MNNKRNIHNVAAICGLVAIPCAILPISALAQTATPVNDQIKELQNEIRNIQKQYQTQIHSLQKQLDDLKAAQTAVPSLRHRRRRRSDPFGDPADGRCTAAAGAGRTWCSAASD